MQEPIFAEMAAFPVKTEIRLQWGDMDAAQHVNNVVYLRWFETARVDYFLRLGQDVVFNDDQPGFILASQDCKYLFPITFPDTLIAAVRIAEVKADRFTMHCKMFSRRHQRLAAIANGVVVTYNYAAQKKTEIPRIILEKIADFETEPVAGLEKLLNTH